MNTGNLFNIEDVDLSENQEVSAILAEGKNVRIERIVSTGQVTEPDFWYDQTENEFVIVLQGEAKLLIEGEAEILLNKGDYVLLPAHCRHRVTYTSIVPACIWLAIFYDIRNKGTSKNSLTSLRAERSNPEGKGNNVNSNSGLLRSARNDVSEINRVFRSAHK